MTAFSMKTTHADGIGHELAALRRSPCDIRRCTSPSSTELEFPPPPERALVVLHPSDELYGADRVLLEVLDSVAPSGNVEVLLPTDVTYPQAALSGALTQRGFSWRRHSFPVLRRARVKVRALPAMVRDALSAFRFLKRRRPEVVYLSTSATLLAGPMARLVGARVVLHVHEWWRPGLERTGLGLLALSCSDVVCVSRATQTGLPAFLKHRSRVIYNGIQRPSATEAAVPAARGFVYLVASRWNEWKGHRILLDAWDIHVARGHDSDQLWILGGPPASGSAFDVASAVSRLHSVESISILGERHNVGDYIYAADCVVVPSIRPDPLPTIAIEAASLGVPVIASRSGGLTEIVDDGITGLLVKPADPSALANAMSTIREMDLEHVRAAAVQRYEGLFSLERFHDEMRRLLRGPSEIDRL